MSGHPHACIWVSLSPPGQLACLREREEAAPTNALASGMLFLVGYQWGVAAYAYPWRTGFAFLGAGLALVGIAIALGG